MYDQAFGEIAQGGSRRGANMGVLRVDHPDIEQFIACKAEEGTISNFNISVAITDEFMTAVRNDADFDLRNPRDGGVWRTLRARDLFEKIVRYAHHNGEPGALFIDAANRTNPVPHLYELEATNPCGEQWLGPYENCCLGSINLAHHTTDSQDTTDLDHAAGERGRVVVDLGDVAEERAGKYAFSGQCGECEYICTGGAGSGGGGAPGAADRAWDHGAWRPDVQVGDPVWKRRGAGICGASDGICALPLHDEEHRAGV